MTPGWLVPALVLAALVPAGPAGATTVCASGCDHTTLQAAHEAATAGDTIGLVGRVNGALRVEKPVVLDGGGGAVLDCRGARPAEGKSCLLPLSATPTTVRDLAIRGATTATDGIGACIRGGDAAPADIAVERVTCDSGHNGIMGPFGRLTVRDSAIRPAGGARGFRLHALYGYARDDIGNCEVFSVDSDWIADARAGAAISQKCRTSRFTGGTISAWESAAVDIRRGDGRHRFERVAIVKPANAPNRTLISFGRTDGCGAGGGVIELIDVVWPSRPPDSRWFWPFPERWRIVSDTGCGSEIVANRPPPRHIATPANFRVDPALR